MSENHHGISEKELVSSNSKTHTRPWVGSDIAWNENAFKKFEPEMLWVWLYEAPRASLKVMAKQKREVNHCIWLNMIFVTVCGILCLESESDADVDERSSSSNENDREDLEDSVNDS
jgi:hypothetical protein